MRRRVPEHVPRSSLVPRERLELSLLSEPDFESGVSTDSTTPARADSVADRRSPGVSFAERSDQPLSTPRAGGNVAKHAPTSIVSPGGSSASEPLVRIAVSIGPSAVTLR